MDSSIHKRIDEWTRPPFDTGTIREIQALAEKNDEKELEDRSAHRFRAFASLALATSS